MPSQTGTETPQNDAGSYVDDAELYDVGSGKWYDAGTGSMFHFARFSGALLPDGRAIFAGGQNETPGASTNLLVATCAPDCTYSSSQSLAAPRRSAPVVVTGRGAVIVNGLLAAGPAFSEVYDFTGVLSGLTAAAPYATKMAAAVQLGVGDLYVCGGEQGSTALGTVMTLPAHDGGWSVASAALTTGRYGATLTSLLDGGMLCIGGLTMSNNTASGEISFLSLSGQTGTTHQLMDPRGNHSASLFNGDVLICGGLNLSTPLSSCERVDASGTSTNSIGMHELRYGHSAHVLSDGTVLVTGGSPDAGCISERFDGGQWTCLP